LWLTISLLSLFWLLIEQSYLRRSGYEGLIIGMRDRFGTAGEAFIYIIVDTS